MRLNPGSQTDDAGLRCDRPHRPSTQALLRDDPPRRDDDHSLTLGTICRRVHVLTFLLTVHPDRAQSSIERLGCQERP